MKCSVSCLITSWPATGSSMNWWHVLNSAVTLEVGSLAMPAGGPFGCELVGCVSALLCIGFFFFFQTFMVPRVWILHHQVREWNISASAWWMDTKFSTSSYSSQATCLTLRWSSDSFPLASPRDWNLWFWSKCLGFYSRPIWKKSQNEVQYIFHGQVTCQLHTYMGPFSVCSIMSMCLSLAIIQ